MIQLRDLTGESAQLYRRQGDSRICVAAAERATGLRDTVPVGSALPMTAGSAAQVLLAWDEPDRVNRGLRGARFTATSLAQVRRRGWAASVAEREAGVASVSAPVRGQGGKIIAAVSVSGPIERLTRSPGRLHAAAVVAAGEKITATLRRSALPARTARGPPRRHPPGSPAHHGPRGGGLSPAARVPRARTKMAAGPARCQSGPGRCQRMPVTHVVITAGPREPYSGGRFGLCTPLLCLSCAHVVLMAGRPTLQISSPDCDAAFQVTPPGNVRSRR